MQERNRERLMIKKRIHMLLRMRLVWDMSFLPRL
jgi:hypothetical protein